MQEIDYLEQNKKKKLNARRLISSLTSLSGYMVGAVLIGMYIDDKFFNKNGISVIVAVLVAILAMAIKVIRLVIDSREI